MSGLAGRRMICNRLGDRYYPPAARRDQRLRAAIEAHLPGRGVFVDAGCGPYLGLARHFVAGGRLCAGMDLAGFDAVALASGARGVIGDLEALPFAPATVDVISMRSVVEHLADPVKVFRGLRATLKPGGWIVALTPSRWYYASLIGRLLPESFARRLLTFIFGPTVYDNYPTYYRANTPRAILKVARAAGLDLVEAAVCPHPPDYLKFSPVMFRAGVVYDRVAGWSRVTQPLQASYLYLLRRPEAR